MIFFSAGEVTTFFALFLVSLWIVLILCNKPSKPSPIFTP